MTVPTTHPFATHLGRVAAAEPHAAWTPGDGALPALYLSHGAPPLFDDDGVDDASCSRWARTLPRPKAILIVSAHWEAAPLSLSARPPATTPVYDFGGFAPEVLLDALRHPGRHGARRRGARRCCRTASPCTSSRAAGWTTAPGCR